MNHAPKEEHPWMDPKVFLLIFLKSVQSSNASTSTIASKAMLQIWEPMDLLYIVLRKNPNVEVIKQVPWGDNPKEIRICWMELQWQA